MVVSAKVYPVGKNDKPSKQGKFKYTFVNGVLSKQGALLDRCDSFSYWSDVEYDLQFMQPVDADLEINGEFVSVIALRVAPVK